MTTETRNLRNYTEIFKRNAVALETEQGHVPSEAAVVLVAALGGSQRITPAARLRHVAGIQMGCKTLPENEFAEEYRPARDLRGMNSDRTTTNQKWEKIWTQPWIVTPMGVTLDAKRASTPVRARHQRRIRKFTDRISKRGVSLGNANELSLRQSQQNRYSASRL